ncbi:MAG: pirin family protein [Xanthomonadales bacterium PRO7]|nr:pirin family protein [Xanthomonadales bacterium PRO7]
MSWPCEYGDGGEIIQSVPVRSRYHNPVDTITVIDPKVHDLGGFSVRRVLPQLQARRVGPFVFFDHMGPARFAPGQGMDVRPHPHIGLATVTYLFEGAIEHRDNLGNVQVIRAGDVNWMTAGRGIVHSERTPAAERAAGQSMHGIQTWVALPKDAEEVAPEFHHHAAATLPAWESNGVRLRLVAGETFGRRSPVHTFSRLFYVAAEFSAGAAMAVPAEHSERAVYATDSPITVAGVELAVAQMAVLPAGMDVEIRADGPARVILCGGDPLDGDRHLWWNFVSSSRERIEKAKADWAAMRYAPVPGETEFIPLPYS